MSRSLALMLCAPAVMLMACSMESKPDEAFLDSSMILRPGVNDFGSSVRKYVDFLETRAQHDGSLVQVTGWKRTNAGYALNLKLKVPVKLEFIWSEQEKLSLLQYADMGGQRLPGMDFFMLSMSAPVHPSKVAKAQELQSQASPSTSAPPATPASTAGTAAQEAPSASQAEMDAESEGVPSDSVPTAAQAPTPQVKPQTRTAAATGQVTEVPNLCSPDETPVFACSTGKKRASLCMSNDESQLTYRLAPLGGAPEMVYPANAEVSRTAFKPGEHVTANRQTLPFMSFDKGNYRYAVYGTTTTMQGILVEQNGKRIANLSCQADRLSELGAAWFQRLYMGLDRDKRPLQLP